MKEYGKKEGNVKIKVREKTCVKGNKTRKQRSKIIQQNKRNV